jgi:type I restriction enzyme S subunit
MSDDYQARTNTLSDVVWPVDEKIAVKKDLARPYVGLEHIGTRQSQLLGWASSDSSVSVNSVFEEGDVLFGKLRPNLRKCVSAPFAGYCSTDILVLRARPGNDPRFAARVFQTEPVGMEAERTSMGTKMPRTSWKGLSQFPIYLPEPRHQSKIAEILDTLDAAIRGTGAVVAKLAAMKQGLLHDLLTRGIDQNGDLRPPYTEAPHLYHQTPLGWLPKGWDVQCIEQLLAPVDPAMRSGPFGSALLKEELVSSGIPFLGIDNVHVERFDRDFKRFVTPAKFAQLRRYAVRPNDLMITIMGTVGRCCLVPGDIGNALSSKHTWAISLDAGKYSSYLAMLQVNYSDWALRRISKDQQGGTMSAIRSETLRSMSLPVPPMSEQRQIEAVLREASTRISQEKTSLAKLRLQKSGLMEDLLTGRVSVGVLLAPEGGAHGA